MTLLSTDQLVHALAGMPYPARRWQMVTWADHNCATSEIREALRHLPDQEYADFGELVRLLAAIEQRATAVQPSVRDRRTPTKHLTAV